MAKAQKLTTQDIDELDQILSMDVAESQPGTPPVEVPQTPDELPELEVDTGDPDTAEDDEDDLEHVATGLADDTPITMEGSDTPVPLSELKALWTEKEALEARLEAARNEVMIERARTELYLGVLNDLPPAVREAIDLDHANRIAREGHLMLEAIPEMATETGKAAVCDELYAIAAKYGYTKSDINKITDHKTIKMLLDFARQTAKIENAMRNVKPLRAATVKPVPGKIQPDNKIDSAISRAQATKTHGDELAAIALL